MTIPPDKSDMINPSEPIKVGPGPTTPAGSGFQSYMTGAGSPTKGAAPGEMAQQARQAASPTQAGTPSLETIATQLGTSQDSIANVRNQLDKLKNTQLTRSQTHLIRNKLNDANTYLRAANSKMGADVPAAPPSGQGPIAKFLSYVVDGENQLSAARHKLSSLAKTGDQLRPADMLLVQIKLNQAEQEISYASMLLNKVTSSISQILSTQL